LHRKSKQLYRFYDKLYCDSNGILYKKGNFEQIVLPKVYHSIVYQELHSNLGHLNSDKVLDLSRKRFYWPGMATDISNFIKNKCRCIISKKPNIASKAPLVNIVSTEPFELVSMDYLHLDKSKGGFEYLLVVVDHFTRFVQAYPTKNKSAKSAAEKLYNNYILNFGYHKRIHHDLGAEFNNTLFKGLHSLSGIKQSHTTPYHPMGNGQCERFNRTIINMLKTLPENFKTNWHLHTKKLTHAYNCTVNKSTGFSPFFLMFGRESKLPIDQIFNTDINQSKANSKTHETFIKDWHRSMKEAIEIVKRNVENKNCNTKRYYDKNIYGDKISVNDRVLVKNFEKGGTGKLRNFWDSNIYKVVTKKDNIPVFVVEPENGGKRKTIHRNLIHKCDQILSDSNCEQNCKPTRPRPLSNHPSPSESDSSDSDFENDQIVKIVSYLQHKQPNSELKRGEEKDTDSSFNDQTETFYNSNPPPESPLPQSPLPQSPLLDTNQSPNLPKSPTSPINFRRSKRIRKARKIFSYDEKGNPYYV